MKDLLGGEPRKRANLGVKIVLQDVGSREGRSGKSFEYLLFELDEAILAGVPPTVNSEFLMYRRSVYLRVAIRRDPLI